MDDLKGEMSFLSIRIFAGLFRAKSTPTADRLENGRLGKAAANGIFFTCNTFSCSCACVIVRVCVCVCDCVLCVCVVEINDFQKDFLFKTVRFDWEKVRER